MLPFFQRKGARAQSRKENSIKEHAAPYRVGKKTGKRG
jgi:hypothetical protein